MPSPTPTETPTLTPTLTPTTTVTPTNTISPTRTNIPTRTPTKTITKTPTNTPSNTSTPSVTPTNTPTNTETQTPTPTNTLTQTSTMTQTPTSTQTQTVTNTPTKTQTQTVTRTQTPTVTASNTQTPTKTATPTVTPTITPTTTLTPTRSAIICGSGITQSNYVYYDCCGNVITGNTAGKLITLDYTKSNVGISLLYIPSTTFCVTKTPTLTPTRTPTPSVTKTTTPSVTKTQTQTQSSSPVNRNSVLNQPKFYVNSCDTFVIEPLGLECRTLTYPLGQNGTGSIAIMITGGTPPYSVYWNNIQTNSQVLNNVGPGSYDVLVVDKFGDFSARTTCILTAITPTPTSSPTPTPTPGATPPPQICLQSFYSEEEGITNAAPFARNSSSQVGIPNYYPVTFDVSNINGQIRYISLSIFYKTAINAKTVGMLLVNPTGTHKTLLYGGGPRGFLSNNALVKLESSRTSQWDGYSSGEFGVNNNVTGGDMYFPSPADITYYDGTTGPNFDNMLGLTGNEVNGRWKLYIATTAKYDEFSFENFSLNINQCTTPPVIPNICFQFYCKSECGMNYSWTFTPRGTDSTGHERWSYDDPGGWSYDIYWSTSSNSWVCELRGGINSCRNSTTSCPCCKALVFRTTSTRAIPTTGWSAVSIPSLSPQTLSEINNSLLISSGQGLLCQGYTANISLSLNSKVDPSCGGTCDGTINVNVVGGVPPYTFSLDNGTPQSQGIFTNVCYGNGTHNVLVTDSLGNRATLPVTFNYSNPTSIYNISVYSITNISNTSSTPNSSTDFSRWTVSVQPQIPVGVTLNVTLSVEIEQTIYEPGTGNISYVNEVYLDNNLQSYNSISQTTSVVPRLNCVGENTNIQTYTEIYNLQLTNTSEVVGESTSTLTITNGNVDQNGCTTQLSQSILATVIDATLTSCDCCMAITSENSGGINLHTFDAPTVEEGDSFVMYANGLRSVFFDRIYSAVRVGTGGFRVIWGDGTEDIYPGGYDINISHTYNSITYPSGYKGQIVIKSSSLSNIDTIKGANTVPSSNPSSGYYPLTITSGQLKKLTKLNNFELTNSNVFFSGIISELPRELTTFSVYRTNLAGGTNQLPSVVLKTFNIIDYTSNTNITGTTTTLPRTLTGITIQSDNVITGDILSLPPNLVQIILWGRNTLSGKISSLPSTLQNVFISGLNTINGYVSGHVWSTRMNQLQITSTLSNTNTDNDYILIDLNNQITTWNTPKYIYLKGGRTAASLSALNSLNSKGVTVTLA